MSYGVTNPGRMARLAAEAQRAIELAAERKAVSKAQDISIAARNKEWDQARSDAPVAAVPISPLEYALAYAALGWQVLPVGADKKPLAGKGIKHATTDAAIIRKWWARWPDAGIGIHLAAAGLCAIDELGFDRGLPNV